MNGQHRIHPVIWHPDGRRVLRRGEGWPAVRLQEDQQIAEAVEAAWGLVVWTLHDGGLLTGRSGQPRLQALQESTPDGLKWEEVGVPPLAHARPWQLPGWPARARAWTEHLLASHSLSLRGEPRVLSANDLGFVLRVETTLGSAFFKVSDSSHEAAVTGFLCHTLPEVLPPVLRADPATNSLLTRSGGELLDGVTDLDAWIEAVQRLAQFQQQADAHALAELSCPSFPLSEMADHVDAFLADLNTLRGWGVEEDCLEMLSAARPAVRVAFRELAALDLPNLPAHGDAHPRNALSGSRGSVWFDWSEAASSAHPFMDAGWFLAFTFHPARAEQPISGAHPDLEQRLTWAYLSALGCPDAAPLLSRAVPLALLHRAVIYDARFGNWEGTVPDWRPNFVPYSLRLAARELARLRP
ncbi:phosphotransferase [Deinococcus frigens]|uniref:phosphotransferase n=1 Tax=Deinococcus frigens TaxID=249403 RepID=UPI0004964571|nr:phosphotransferase [Deinococcus frigens]